MKRGKMVSKMVFLSIILLFLAGCAETEKTVRITSTPSGATIYLNSAESGITPLTQKLSFAESSEINVVAKKQKYQDSKITIRLEPISQTNYHISLKEIEAVSIPLVSFEPKVTEKGVKLSIVHKPTLAYLEIIERSPTVKSVTKVTNNNDADTNIDSLVLSPIDDTIVYCELIKEEKESRYSNIWKTAVGSFGKTRVTYGKWLDSFPYFTPDGQFLLFSSNRTSSNQTLWKIRVDGGGGITNITRTPADDYSPSMAQDGNYIVYASNPPGAEEPQIWTIGINGNLPTQLREGDQPCVSPDGKKILFVRPDKISHRKQIWVMNTDGSEETQLTPNTNYDAGNPKWSPDGKWIVFDSDEGLDSKKLSNYDIWLMTVDAAMKTQLTTNGSRDDKPCWDRTGKYIYFRSNRGAVWDIWRFEPILP